MTALRKYITIPVLISLGNLAVAGFSYATGHADQAQFFFALFLGQWVQSPHASIVAAGAAS